MGHHLRGLPGALVVVVAALTATPSSQAQTCTGTTIDDFSLGQTLLQLAVPPSAPQAIASLSANSTTILGQEREMLLELSGATANGSNDVSVNSSLLQYNSTTGIAGRFRLIYDGDDNSTGTINFTGLGGTNLTAGGGVGFEIFADTDLTTRLQMRVYTDATHYSDLTDAAGGSGTLGFPLTPAGPFAVYKIPYSFFGTGAGAAGPATLTNVGAIEVSIDPVPALDIKFDYICVTNSLPVELQEFRISKLTYPLEPGPGKF